jgi:hypothetical protein
MAGVASLNLAVPAICRACFYRFRPYSLGVGPSRFLSVHNQGAQTASLKKQCQIVMNHSGDRVDIFVLLRKGVQALL